MQEITLKIVVSVEGASVATRAEPAPVACAPTVTWQPADSEPDDCEPEDAGRKTLSTAQINFRCTPAFRQQVNAMAARYDRSVADLMEEAIELLANKFEEPADEQPAHEAPRDELVNFKTTKERRDQLRQLAAEHDATMTDIIERGITAVANDAAKTKASA